MRPFNEFNLKVSDLHTLYGEEYGNPKGYPVVYLHGGPGAGCSYTEHELFDPDFYRIILFDQRGAGKSEPYAEVREQSTELLVQDIDTIRTHFNINRWAVIGGSWGSALALTYADAHPDKTDRLLLRGLFLADKAGALNISEDGGANRIRGDYWGIYGEWSKVKDSGSLIDAYHQALNGNDEFLALEAATRFMAWDNSIATADYDIEAIGDAYKNPRDQLAISRLWFHYAKNEFMRREETQLLSMQTNLSTIPINLVHGEKDYICPAYNADRFIAAYPHANVNIVRGGGHSAGDSKISGAMKDVTERWKGDINSHHTC